MAWTPSNIPELTHHTAIVTGGNSGIGLETVRELARKGARVILACRALDKGQQARDAVLADQPSAAIEVWALDLASLASVRSFADKAGSSLDCLDLLINNAGVMIPPFGKTEDGFELQMGTNHLGHFALTGLLLNQLLATPKARIVTVSSIAHKLGRIDFDNLNAEQTYDRIKAYAQSKLANLLFSLELSRRLAAKHPSLLALSAHPGWTATNLARHSSPSAFFGDLLAMRPLQGALPTLRAATDSDALSGAYYGPDGPFEVRGDPVVVEPRAKAKDVAVAQRLWARSEELTGVSYSI